MENQRRQNVERLFVQEKPGQLKKNKDVNEIDEMYHDTEFSNSEVCVTQASGGEAWGERSVQKAKN